MTDSSLKSVFTLDTETQVFKPVAHNLNAGEAIERFNADPQAKIVDQSEHHRSTYLPKCKACKKAAEELTSKHMETAGPEADEETVSAQESESD
jgi:hypothetical protein